MATPIPIPTPQQAAEPQQETPRLSYRTRRTFEMREASFGAATDEAICKWVYEQIDTRKKQLKNLHEHKVPEWRRMADGKPREENKSWPFENCLGLDTEVLTSQGWKSIGDVKVGEQVYSRSECGCAAFFPVIGTTRAVSDEMVHFKGKSIDLLVTPNHQMLVEDWKGDIGFKEADYFLRKKTTAYHIPLTSKKISSTRTDYYGISARNYLRLLGWYLSEGSITNSGSFFIAQTKSANPEKYETLRADIEACGVTCKDYPNGFTVHAKSMHDGMKQEWSAFGLQPQRRIPRNAFEASPEDLLELLDRLVLGDGSNHPDTVRTYYTTSKGLADDVQELCQYAGIRAAIDQRKAGNKSVIRGKIVTSKLDGYVVSILKRTSIKLKTLKRSRVDGRCEVACVETAPHHTIYVRRNGVATWIGNCSNLVHQIIGETNDESNARVIQLVWAIAPILNYHYFTKAKDQTEAEHNSKKAKTLQTFMDYVAFEHGELDLYRVENLWFSDSGKLGTAWICAYPEKRVEAVYIGYEPQSRRKEFEEAVLYEGPKVGNPRFEDVLFDPDANTPEDSVFLSRKVTLNRRDLQERVFFGHYRKEDVKKILGKPDRYGPTDVKKRENQRKGVVDTEDRILAEWDIYECYFYWYHNKKKFRLIAWFHFETKTMLNVVFNFIPDNQIPLVRTRLSMGEHGMLGKGYAETLKDAQDEISTAKNMRNDATTWAMLGLNRLSPANRNIDKNMKVFPGATLPFGSGEFEHYNVGNVDAGQLSLANEQAMIQQARERAGVGPARMGMGTGQTDKKGRYGSMGTLAVLQEGNSRDNHRTSDFRHSHVRVGALLTDMYGAMGLGRKGSLFGLDDKLLEEALSDFLERKMKIPIRAVTASANREVTKQNLLLLNQALSMHIKEMMNLLQAVDNAAVPPHVKKYLRETIKAKNHVVQNTVREFQLSDQPAEYVPEIEFPEEQQQNAPPPQTPAQPIDARLRSMAEAIRQPRSSVVPGAEPGIPPSAGGFGGPPGSAGV